MASDKYLWFLLHEPLGNALDIVGGVAAYMSHGHPYPLTFEKLSLREKSANLGSIYIAIDAPEGFYRL